MPSKLNIVVKIPPSNFPDGSYMTIIPDPVNPSLAPLFAGSIGYVSGVSTIESVDVDAGSYLNGYAIDNLATHLNGAVITATTLAIPDTNAPTFSLSPSQTSYTITEGDAFFVPTLTLTDDVDGSSTPSPTSNTVDTSTAGNYEITWSGLSDSAGNVIEDVTVSVVVQVVEVTSRVFINLETTSNSYYSLSTPVLFSGDFEIAVSFSTLDNSGTLLSGSKQSTDIIAMDVLFGKLRAFCFVGTSLQTVLSSTVDVNNGKLNRAKLRYIGGTAYLYFNNTIVDSGTWSLTGGQDIKLFGKRSGSNSLQGITADVELTDITTPANSFVFPLDNLTSNTETSNGVTLTYQNISTEADVRKEFETVDNKLISNEIVVNGDFANNDAWLVPAGWAINTALGLAEANGTFNNAELRQEHNYLKGATYEVSYEILSIDSGVIVPRMTGGGVLSGNTQNSAGIYTDLYTLGVNLSRFDFLSSGGDGAVATIRNVSAKQIIDIAAQA